jgi:5'-3' exonuclease
MPAPRPAGLACIDAHQLLFRAWHGFPARITSRDKERDLTGIFGFFALLRAGLRDNIGEPTEVLAVFDGEGRRRQAQGHRPRLQGEPARGNSRAHQVPR